MAKISPFDLCLDFVLGFRSTSQLPYSEILIFVNPPLENKTKTSHGLRFYGPMELIVRMDRNNTRYKCFCCDTFPAAENKNKLQLEQKGKEAQAKHMITQ